VNARYEGRANGWSIESYVTRVKWLGCYPPRNGDRWNYMGPVDIPRARPSLKDAAQRRQASWPTLSVIPRGKIGGKEERPQPFVVCIATTIVVANKSARMASAMMAGGECSREPVALPGVNEVEPASVY